MSKGKPEGIELLGLEARDRVTGFNRRGDVDLVGSLWLRHGYSHAGS